MLSTSQPPSDRSPMLQDQTATSVAPQAPSGPYTAREMYEAAQLQRRTVRDQLSSAVSQRDELAGELRQPDVTGVDKAGLEQRLQVLDSINRAVEATAIPERNP